LSPKWTSDIGSFGRNDLAIGVDFSHLGRGGCRLDSEAAVEGDGVEDFESPSARSFDFTKSIREVTSQLKDGDNAASALMRLISKLFLLDGDAVVTVDLDQLFLSPVVAPFFGKSSSNKLYLRFEKSMIGIAAKAHLRGEGHRER
jgi:hypothetical protein